MLNLPWPCLLQIFDDDAGQTLVNKYTAKPAGKMDAQTQYVKQ